MKTIIDEYELSEYTKLRDNYYKEVEREVKAQKIIIKYNKKINWFVIGFIVGALLTILSVLILKYT